MNDETQEPGEAEAPHEARTAPTAPAPTVQKGAGPPSRPGIKILVEVGPLVVFFVTNNQYGIFKATGAFMVAITLSLVASKLFLKRLPPMALFTAAFVLVMGGLTLWLEDELFIKLKPTIVNTLFALMLGLGLAWKKLLLRFAFGDAFELTEEGWRKMTVRWIGFFVVLAILNEVVWRNFSTDSWVTFKTFGVMPLTLVFSMTLVPIITRYQIKSEGEDAAAG